MQLQILEKNQFVLVYVSGTNDDPDRYYRCHVTDCCITKFKLNHQQIENSSSQKLIISPFIDAKNLNEMKVECFNLDVGYSLVVQLTPLNCQTVISIPSEFTKLEAKVALITMDNITIDSKKLNETANFEKMIDEVGAWLRQELTEDRSIDVNGPKQLWGIYDDDMKLNIMKLKRDKGKEITMEYNVNEKFMKKFGKYDFIN